MLFDDEPEKSLESKMNGNTKKQNLQRLLEEDVPTYNAGPRHYGIEDSRI